MGPIEGFFFGIGVIIVMIGFVRGYVKELGVTIMVMAAIFVLIFLDEQITRALNVVAGDILGIPEGDGTTRAQFFVIFYCVLFISIVFASYAGRTFSFSGKPAPPPQGPIITLAVGLLNAYLISGTIWYFLDEYGYPFPDIILPLSSTATMLIPLLPGNLIPNPVYWMVPIAVLIIWSVRG